MTPRRLGLAPLTVLELPPADVVSCAADADRLMIAAGTADAGIALSKTRTLLEPIADAP